MGRVVIACYVPKAGRESELYDLARTHVPRLRAEGLVTDREPIIALAADGTVVEVFEWSSEEAIAAAHTNPAVRAMWEEYDLVCTYRPVGEVPEAARLFSELTPLPRNGSRPPASTPKEVVASFTDDEVAYLRSQPVARLASVGDDHQPDVVPVAFEFDGARFWVGGSGDTVLRTRKFRNVAAGHGSVALVVDDVVSFDPFVARGIRVYGEATGPVERDGMVGPGFYLRITPSVSWSWNMAGEPVGESWYESRKAFHDRP